MCLILDTNTMYLYSLFKGQIKRMKAAFFGYFTGSAYFIQIKLNLISTSSTVCNERFDKGPYLSRIVFILYLKLVYYNSM